MLSLLAAAVVARGAVAPGAETTSDHASRTFRVRGSISGLVAGRPDRMRVRLRNRDDVAIVVRHVGAVVTSPLASCPARTLRVDTWRGERRVPPHGVRRVTVHVTLSASAPDDCYGMRYTLHYTGRAVKAGSP